MGQTQRDRQTDGQDAERSLKDGRIIIQGGGRRCTGSKVSISSFKSIT